MQHLRRFTTGKLVALVTVATVVVVYVASGGKMFSPGGLNAESRGNGPLGGVASHAEIGGNCAACHVPPWSGETMANRCLSCHTDIRRQLDTQQSLHGKLAGGMECRNCHTEHKGPQGIVTSMSTFDHDCAAFPLTGGHRLVDCKTCHLGNAFKGTPQTCAGCHAEPPVHKGKFGTSCAQCHSTNSWRSATVSLKPTEFDHEVTGFKLTGKHKSVDCKSCHVNNVFKGTPQTCVGCHAEPLAHKGKFGNSCAQCHSTNTWSGAAFKHTFPLKHGRGKKNDCAICHKDSSNFKSYTCYGCHEHQPAKIEKRHAKIKTKNLQDCAYCHPTGREHKGKKGFEKSLSTEFSACCPVMDDFLPTLYKRNLPECCGAAESLFGGSTRAFGSLSCCPTDEKRGGPVQTMFFTAEVTKDRPATCASESERLPYVGKALTMFFKENLEWHDLKCK